MHEVGVIGLGVMGKNLVWNFIDHNYKVHVFNRTISKTEELQEKSPNILGYDDLNAFVLSLKIPRKILLMVSAGKPVDEYLKSLAQFLDKNDIVIDCGNSDYEDTIRRVKENDFNVVGCGMSGGEYGARHGLSLMIGCKKNVFDQIENILGDISAKYNNMPCCKWMGNDGAGHFVKIVHNGIEYCEMQLLQELLNMSPSHEFSLEYLNLFNSGRCKSYLTDICLKILNTKNESGHVLYQIKDQAEQKGTGKLCVESAIEINTDVILMAQSVFSRYLSNAKEIRVEFNERLSQYKTIDLIKRPVSNERKNEDFIDLETIEKAFYLAKALSFIQGGNLLINKKAIHGWDYTIPDICAAWRNGCILKCEFLSVFEEMSQDNHFELSRWFMDILNECLPSLKEICFFAIKNNLYCPVLTNCLMWINGISMVSGNGNLLQAMRDYFGRHGVVLNNGKETNIEWNE